MAQGKMKVKNANVQKKLKHKKNKLGPKKGGKISIAPKKFQKVKEKQLKQHLQKNIQQSIEEQLVQKAGSNSLTVIGNKAKPRKNDKKK